MLAAGSAWPRPPSNGLPAKFAREARRARHHAASAVAEGAPVLVQASHYVSHPSEPNPDERPSTRSSSRRTAPRPPAARRRPQSSPVERPPARQGVVHDPLRRAGRDDGDRQRCAGWPSPPRAAARIYVYLQREPMATELAEVAVGRYRGHRRAACTTASSCATSIAPSLAVAARGQAAHGDQALDWMQDQVGDYPFDVYGSLVVDVTLGFALETQTLSLYEGHGRQDLRRPRRVGADHGPRARAHVVRRQRRALLVERPVAQRGPRHVVRVDLGGRRTASSRRTSASPTSRSSWRSCTRSAIATAPRTGPVGAAAQRPARGALQPHVYFGGALVLYALRQQVGETEVPPHRARLGQPLPRRRRLDAGLHRARLRVSGQDLTAFLNAWVYGDDDATHAGTPGLDGRPRRDDGRPDGGRPGGPYLPAAPLDHRRRLARRVSRRHGLTRSDAVDQSGESGLDGPAAPRAGSTAWPRSSASNAGGSTSTAGDQTTARCSSGPGRAAPQPVRSRAGAWPDPRGRRPEGVDPAPRLLATVASRAPQAVGPDAERQ